MRKRKSGFIVFIGSSGGIGGEPGAGPVSRLIELVIVKLTYV
jgi:hypothetical protein